MRVREGSISPVTEERRLWQLGRVEMRRGTAVDEERVEKAVLAERLEGGALPLEEALERGIEISYPTRNGPASTTSGQASTMCRCSSPTPCSSILRFAW